MRPTHASRQKLATRLRHLRQRLEYLRAQERIGADVRGMLLDMGLAVWVPERDLLWRAWILHRGDPAAKAFLRELDKAAMERMAEIEARARRESGTSDEA